MKSLPLYTDTRAAIERVGKISKTDPACTMCKLSDGVRSVCIGADGQRPDPTRGFDGAVLVLGDYPSEMEDASRRPVSHGPNSTLREVVEKLHAGPVVYATALRCAPKARKISDRTVEVCSQYTRGLIEEIKPSRILCFGKRAYQAVLGSSCDSIQLGRRGYGYLSDGTPVFMLHAARRVTPNRFLFRQWSTDIEWALSATPPLPPWDGVIKVVETVDDAYEAAAVLRRSGAFTYDTETAGLMGDAYFQVVCLTATPVDDLDVSYLWDEQALQDARLAPLADVMRDASVGKIGHNLKFDFEAVAHGLGLRDDHGVLQVRGVRGDTLLWARTLDTECKGALDHVDHRVGMGGHKDENAKALAGAIERVRRARADPRRRRVPSMTHPALEASVRHPDVKPEAFAYGLIPREVLYRYCALDTVATARVHALLEPIVDKAPHYHRVSEVLHKPVTAAIAQIESWGMSADIGAARAFGQMLEPRRDACLSKIAALGCNVDVNSPQQLGQYLYGELSLPVLDLTRTGQPKTDAKTLAKLRDKHPVIEPILEHAKINKLLGTYVTGLIPHIRPDGRIRSSLNIAGARSGRMSSSNPNLQNIPSSGEYAKMAKAIFNAAPGHVLLQLDYSQLEVRVAAIVSGEPRLRQAYIDGVDVHRRTASNAFAVDEAHVTKVQRRDAKAVVFGVLYGKSARSLSVDLGTSLAHGQAIYDSVLGSMPVLVEWMAEQRRNVDRYGVTWTYLTTEDGLQRARCRQLWQIAEPDSARQSVARNGAVNTPIQGTASDFMLRTLVAVVDWIVSDGVPARVVNTVHDSIILEVPFAWALEVAQVVKAIMESWPSLGVPIVADVDVGLTWGSLFSLGGLQLVGGAVRNGLTDAEIIHLAETHPTAGEELGDDPAAWLAKARHLAGLVGA